MMLCDILKPCEEYGYTAEQRGDMVYITSQYEHWSFEANSHPRAKVKLLHRGLNGEGYHRQFHTQITPHDLILYIRQHELARFTRTFVKFEFTKDGIRLDSPEYKKMKAKKGKGKRR